MSQQRNGSPPIDSALNNSFSFIPEGGGYGLYEAIEGLLTPGDNIWDLCARTRLNEEEVKAVSSLLQRGMERLSAQNKRDMRDDKLSFESMPYPILEAVLYMVTKISEFGQGRRETTMALTGIMASSMGPSDPEKDEKKREKESQSSA